MSRARRRAAIEAHFAAQLPSPPRHAEAAAILRDLERFAERRAIGGPRAPIESGVSVARPLLNRVLRSIGPDALASLDWETPTVWSLAPRRGERRLPREIQSGVDEYLSLVSALAEVMPLVPPRRVEEHAADAFERLRTLATGPATIGEIVVSVRRTEEQLFAILHLYDPAGEMLDGATTSIPLSTGPDPRRRGDPQNRDALIPLPLDAARVAVAFSDLRSPNRLPVFSDPGPRGRSLTPKPLSIAADTEVLDLFVSPAYAWFEERLGAPPVFVLPDSTLTVAWSSMRVHMDAEAFLESFIASMEAVPRQAHGHVWLVPADLDTLPHLTTRRSALRDFLRQVDREGRVSLAEWSQLCARAGSAPSRSPLVVAWVRVLGDQGIAWDAGSVGFAAWRFLGDSGAPLDAGASRWVRPATALPAATAQAYLSLARSFIGDGSEPTVDRVWGRWADLTGTPEITVEHQEEAVVVAARGVVGAASGPLLATTAAEYAALRAEVQANRQPGEPDYLAGMVYLGTRRVTYLRIAQGARMRLEFKIPGATVWVPEPISDSSLPDPFRAPPGQP